REGPKGATTSMETQADNFLLDVCLAGAEAVDPASRGPSSPAHSAASLKFTRECVAPACRPSALIRDWLRPHCASQSGGPRRPLTARPPCTAFSTRSAGVSAVRADSRLAPTPLRGGPRRP